jgi:hypothetical protein
LWLQKMYMSARLRNVVCVAAASTPPLYAIHFACLFFSVCYWRVISSFWSCLILCNHNMKIISHMVICGDFVFQEGSYLFHLHESRAIGSLYWSLLSWNTLYKCHSVIILCPLSRNLNFLQLRILDKLVKEYGSDLQGCLTDCALQLDGAWW